MACNSCAKSFSLFRKERGCPSCGFSYCSNCLDNKIFVKKLNTEAKVCSKCKNAESSGNETKVEPPEAYYKRIAAHTDNPQSSHSSAQTGSTNETENEILERLQKLKQDREPSKPTTTEDIANRLKKIKGDQPTASDAEIQERLAKLKGLPNISSNTTALPTPDTRTEQQQADDLMKQYLDETKIHTKYKDEFDEVIDGIQNRLQKLKGTDSVKEAGTSEEREESEDELVKKILEMEKYKAETELEIDSPTEGPAQDELPFCEICNEDATLRCLGCKYLFCKRCYLEHRDDDDECNRYEVYKPKTK